MKNTHKISYDNAMSLLKTVKILLNKARSYSASR